MQIMADYCTFLERIETNSPCLKDKYAAVQHFPDVLVFPALSYFFGLTSGYTLGGKHEEPTEEGSNFKPEEITSRGGNTFDSLLKERVSLCDGALLHIQRPVLHGSMVC
jgi:hypothetical protein